MCDLTIDTETRSHWIHEQQLTLINMGYYFHVWNFKILKSLVHSLKFPVIRSVLKFLKIVFFVESIMNCFYFLNHLIPVYFVINKILTIFMTHLLKSKIHNDCYFHHDLFNIYSRVVSYYAKQWLKDNFTFMKRLREKEVYIKLLYTILYHLSHLKTAFQLTYLLQNTDFVE